MVVPLIESTVVSRRSPVYGGDGHVIARVRTPDRTRLLDVGEDYVLGLTTDEFDVDSLTLWTLERTATD